MHSNLLFIDAWPWVDLRMQVCRMWGIFVCCLRDLSSSRCCWCRISTYLLIVQFLLEVICRWLFATRFSQLTVTKITVRRLSLHKVVYRKHSSFLQGNATTQLKWLVMEKQTHCRLNAGLGNSLIPIIHSLPGWSPSAKFFRWWLTSKLIDTNDSNCGNQLLVNFIRIHDGDGKQLELPSLASATRRQGWCYCPTPTPARDVRTFDKCPAASVIRLARSRNTCSMHASFEIFSMIWIMHVA